MNMCEYEFNKYSSSSSSDVVWAVVSLKQATTADPVPCGNTGGCPTRD